MPDNFLGFQTNLMSPAKTAKAQRKASQADQPVTDGISRLSDRLTADERAALEVERDACAKDARRMFATGCLKAIVMFPIRLPYLLLLFTMVMAGEVVSKLLRGCYLISMADRFEAAVDASAETITGFITWSPFTRNDLVDRAEARRMRMQT